MRASRTTPKKRGQRPAVREAQRKKRVRHNYAMRLRPQALTAMPKRFWRGYIARLFRKRELRIARNG